MSQIMRKLGVYLVVTALGATTLGCSDNGEVNGQPDAGPVDTGDEDVGEPDTGEPDTDLPPPECPLSFEDTGQARVFTFGSKIRMDDAESYESYEAYFRGQVHEIADCMSDERPNLLLFPEDAGLHAGLIGSRGEGARGASNAEQAFLQLMLAYNDGPIGHIDALYDDLDTPRLIFLGLTDTLWRAMDQTFSGIADDYDAWVLTSGNVAEIEESTDPQMIEIWADPDLEDVDSVFIPASRKVYNSAIIYNPDGELVTRVHKPYLTQTEEVDLALSYGPLESLRPVEVGPERFGIFTSKDAWMPPANDRLGLLGSTLQVQPEAFSGWTITQHEDQEEWLPDVLTQSGWAAVQKYPSYRYGAMPVLTGNFVGMSFDGQAVVWGQAHPGVDFGGFVGQDERPGFLEVGPWAFDDPGDDDPGLSLQERREQLRELGEALLPGAGEPHENAYVDSVVGRDLLSELVYQEGSGDGGSETTQILGEFTADPSQRVRLASREDRLAAAWQVERDGIQYVEAALLEWNDGDGEYELLRHEELEPAGAAMADSLAPAIVFNEAEEAVIVYQWVPQPGSSILHGVRFGESETTPVEIPQIGEEVSESWLPALAADEDTVALVFTDLNTGHERVYLSLSDDGGATFAEPVAVDGPPEVDPPNTRGHQWHPAVDIKGDTIVVAWTDFRAFQWDLYGTFSLDGGETWADVQRIDDAGDLYERLHTDPRLTLLDEEEALISWTYQADRRPDTDARYRRWNLTDDSFEDSVALDRQSDSYPTHSWLPRVEPVSEEGELAAAWMELRDETSVIVTDVPGFEEPITLSHPGRVAWWPELIVEDDRVVVSWVEHRPGEGFAVKFAHFP